MIMGAHDHGHFSGARAIVLLKSKALLLESSGEALSDGVITF
jgi:hypothetical protein